MSGKETLEKQKSKETIKKVDNNGKNKENNNLSGIKRRRSPIISFIYFIFKLIELIITVVVVFLAIVIITQRITGNQEAFLGFRVFRVETGSMIPKYLIGDVILVKEKDTNKIEIGEDLVYSGLSLQTRGKTITHQLIRKVEEDDGKIGFYTKGIANNAEDPVVYKEQIQGVVLCKLKLLSIFFQSLREGYLLYFIAVIPITIYVFFRIFHREMRRNRKID